MRDQDLPISCSMLTTQRVANVLRLAGFRASRGGIRTGFHCSQVSVVLPATKLRPHQVRALHGPVRVTVVRTTQRHPTNEHMSVESEQAELDAYTRALTERGFVVKRRNFDLEVTYPGNPQNEPGAVYKNAS